jgi:LuxR family quorum sensing-dependent transcriptional regulator
VSDAAFNYRSEAFAFVEEIDRVSEPDEIVRRMQRVLDRSGLGALTIGHLPSFDEQYEDGVLVVRDMPAEYFGVYVEGRYARVDPLLRRLRDSVMPFEYRVEDDLEGEPRARELIRRRREFRLGEGLMIPVPGQHGIGYVWASGERPEFAPGAKPALHLMSLYAFDRISSLITPRPANRRTLTEREREVLRWVAAGKSAWEIGEILCIAKRTVDEHTQTAARKLGAVSRTQAVAIALRDQLIAI